MYIGVCAGDKKPSHVVVRDKLLLFIIIYSKNCRRRVQVSISGKRGREFCIPESGALARDILKSCNISEADYMLSLKNGGRVSTHHLWRHNIYFILLSSFLLSIALTSSPILVSNLH